MKTIIALAAALTVAFPLRAATSQVLSWNNLGMHCMDSDYSVFSILPPYNTIHAQLIINGKLLTNTAGYTVTYQAMADPSGSFNSTARSKGNFYDYALPLYGASVQPEFGLTPWPMPGTNNVPQGMLFETTNHPAAGVATRVNWYRAEGIPITPYDDSGRKNPYPMMRVIARTSAGTGIATNDIVLPVSDEMDCRVCHASGSIPTARPADGWVWGSDPARDYRLNILRLHDQHQFLAHAGLYQAALAARGFNPGGLYRSVVADGKPVLCATCHASEALGTGSYSNLPPLTAAVHSRHANVLDPLEYFVLDSADNRSACYRCHPGSTTRCLRGAMGGAVARDGSMEMQCQSCHGNMSAVGSRSRVGWFMEPNCQSCHTGTATSNNGRIRYDSVFETNGNVRVAVNQTFATSSNTPAAGLSLYRFSVGHGGLQCSACHGSTHAEFPATHANDNVRNEKIQAHAGVTVECTTCHVSMTSNQTNAIGGPHGLHPIGMDWVNKHMDMLGGNVTRAHCQGCHGANYRGTVLARAQTTRSFTTKFGTRTYWRGKQIGCYDCHDGASSSNPSANTPPVVANASTNTLNDASVTMALPGTDANGHPLTFRVVTQPAHGTVGVSNNLAIYFPEPGFTGTAVFTFAANDTYADSNLGTGTVAVAQGPYSMYAEARLPSVWPMDWPMPFSAVPTLRNTTLPVAYTWQFGDGQRSTNQSATHTYRAPGTYRWSLVTYIPGAESYLTGEVTITNAAMVSTEHSGTALILSWPESSAKVVVERTPRLAADPWQAATNLLFLDSSHYRMSISPDVREDYYRLRLVK